jgi:Na+-translocating ferredoxin:NAD+ oxidoreductase subunit D
MTATSEMVSGDRESSGAPSAPQPSLLVVAAPPHLRAKDSVSRRMLWVLLALTPAAGIAIVLYGVHALLSIAASVGAAVAAEYLIAVVAQKKVPLFDGSAVITGLLLAFSLPPQAPLWGGAIGSIFAIAVVKMAFGGLGCNFLNPALAGRAFLLVAFPSAFSGAAAVATQTAPFATLDIKEALLNLFIGYQGGWMGGSSAGALIIGAAVLWYLRRIDFVIPLAFIVSAFCLFWATNGSGSLLTPSALQASLTAILSGGLILVALFMATDPVTSPIALRARLFYGAGCGLLTFAFQKFGSANDGVMQAVLLMNCAAPALDRFLMSKPFGVRDGRRSRHA